GEQKGGGQIGEPRRVGRRGDGGLAMGRWLEEQMARQQGGDLGVSYRLARHAIFLGVTALAVTMADAQQGQSSAQGKLDARYVVTLSGLPIGQGAWVIDIGDDHF